MRKLRLEPQPPEYTADMAAILIDQESGEMVLIGCPSAHKRAMEIRRAVNFHESLVAALQTFQSTEMGLMLVDAVIASCPDGKDPEIVETRLLALINVIDVILKGIELMEERDELRGTSAEGSA